MRPSDTFPKHQPPRLPRLAWARGLLAAAVAVVLLAACGGSSPPAVPHAGSSAASRGRAAVPASGAKSAVAFAACMRAHGVPGFPDPGTNGRFSPGSGVDPGSPAFQAAQKACQSLLPTNGSSVQTQGGSSMSPQKEAQLLAFARCIRAHGVPSFPDPTSQGIALPTGFDLKSPQFHAATQACRRLAPALGQGGGQTAAGSGGGL